MIVSKAKITDVTKIRKLWKDSFPLEGTETNQFFFDHLFRLEDTFLLKEQNEILCMLQTRDMQVKLNEVKNISFIVGIATPRQHRHKGYMKYLLHHVLTQLSKKEDCTFIQAYDWDLYKPFGFIISHYLKEVTIHKRAYQSNCSNYSVKEEEEAKEMLRVYELYTKDKNGYRIRDIAYYNTYLIPYTKADKGEWLYLYKHGKLVGYAIYEDKEYRFVYEFIYVKEQAKDMLLYYLSKVDKEVVLRCSLQDQVQGEEKQVPAMMIKQHTLIDYEEPLFINEYL